MVRTRQDLWFRVAKFKRALPTPGSASGGGAGSEELLRRVESHRRVVWAVQGGVPLGRVAEGAPLIRLPVGSCGVAKAHESVVQRSVPAAIILGFASTVMSVLS